jgi:spore coat protein U-like protein
MRTKIAGGSFALALASLAPISQVEAATTTTNFNVTANVQVSCAITATELAFGTYNKNAKAAVEAQSNVLVTCTNGSTWDLALNKGLHGASVTTRAMANDTAPAVHLNYALFSDPAHTVNWGETAGTDTVTGTGTGVVQAIGVYGQVLANQTSVTAGGYSDTITATLTF